ncbi:MAG TPA: hypothetical protein VF546_00560 [Pyrinomonadaceae bacterium]
MNAARSSTAAPRARTRRWRYGALAALALAALALAPQLHLWAARGRDWRGSYVSFDFDEVAYSAYLNALISGRPRRNDPFTGRADTPAAPLPESLFSIQFVPAYALALPARALGLTAAEVFIILRPLAAAAAALALFWLLLGLTGDAPLAAAAALVVLCLGALAEGPHATWHLLTLRSLTNSLPFLRRYVVACATPLFFVFAALVLAALRAQTTRARLPRAGGAGLVFALLVFTYFYAWTAAAAWLCVLASLWLAARRDEWRRALPVFALACACGAAALAPYALLLARRAPGTDAAQLLTHTRMPLVSTPLFVGLAALLALAWAARRGRISAREPAVLCAASFALLPLVLYNQQVVTGLLLQPVHYGRYVGNYAALLACVLAATLVWRGRTARPVPPRLLACAAVCVLAWSALETAAKVRRLAAHNLRRDETWLVARRLANCAPPDAPAATAAAPADAPVVMASDLALAGLLSNVTTRAVLWAQHMAYSPGATAEEERTRLYRQLYYTGVDEPAFAALAAQESFLRLALFGWERMNAVPYAPPLTAADVQTETRRYAAFVNTFDRARALTPMLACVVVPAAAPPDLTNLDRWYTRDPGARLGDFVVYRVRPRP